MLKSEKLKLKQVLEQTIEEIDDNDYSIGEY